MVTLDDTHMKGWVRFDIPNAVIAASKGRVVAINIYGGTNMAQCPVLIELTGWDNQDAVHGGMSALPNTACTTNASLLTSGTGTAQISTSSGQVILQSGTGTGQLQFTSGIVEANVLQWNSGAVPSPNVTGVPIVDAGYVQGHATAVDANNYLKVDVVDIAGSAVSASSAQIGVNVVQYNGHTAVTDGNNYPSVNLVDIAGSAVSATTAQLGVNVVNWNNTVVATPATAGIPDVNVKNMNNVAATSITTISAYQGTTQPVNFTGTGASALAKVDVTDIATVAVATGTAQIGVNLVNIAGSAVATGTAQLGVNLVNIGGSAVSATTAQLGVNVVNWNNHVVATPATAGVVDVNVKNYNNQIAVTDGNNYPSVNLVDIAGSAVSTSTAQLGVNVVNWGGTATAGAIPPDQVFIRSGTAQAGGASTITLDSGASATNNFYQNQIVYLYSGTGAGQSAIITSYVGSTKVATIVGTWATNPSSSSKFLLLPFGSITTTVSGGVNVTQWNGSSVAAPNVAGVPLVDIGYTLGTTSAGAAGYVGIDWGQITNKTTTNALTGTTISTSQTIATVTNQLTAAAIATGVWQDATAGDFTAASSIGKSLYNLFTVAGGSVFTTASLVNAPTGGSAPTVSQIATAVWQDATSGDFTVSGSIGKSLFTSGVVPGGSGGLLIAGSNAATTVNITGSLSGSVGSVTGNVGGNVVGSTASVTSPVTISLTQALGAARALDSIADTSLTVNDALQCAVGSITAQLDASGGTTLVFKTASTGTTLRTKTLTLITPPSTVPDKAI